MADGSYLKGFGVTFKKLFEDRVTGITAVARAEKGKPDEKREGRPTPRSPCPQPV